ncbi:DUF6701 domain-containing protein [Shewanella sp. 10N.286.52.B9]|uniref:DUF6701 domain-containing protein n=1 Tax=Shewanella sp. 10N.286.52.B9 TaxID=1880837 RepID=UPI000C85C46E|nr:DUF6701 domain-containing protein [Shewanella sp. 10N.286.52.B9]PMG42768.1 hypothetical protein BCU91_07465 [Shewanella sp. 10N.286.52.B9]
MLKQDYLSFVSKLNIGIFLLLISLNSANADWSETFKEGVNNYTSAGIINLNTATIKNAPINGQLPTFNYVQGGASNYKGCIPENDNAKNCKAGNYIASLPTDRIEFSQCESSSNQDVTATSGSITAIPEGEYRNIAPVMADSHSVEFTSDNESAVFRIKSLNVGNGTLKLTAGQYWIETLFLNPNVTLIFPDSGTVSFFVKNDYTHFNLNLIDDAERFLLYHYGDFTLNGGANLTGYVVSEGEAIVSGSANLEGAVTGENVTLQGSSNVTFSGTAANIDVIPNCDLPPDPVIPFHIQYGKSISITDPNTGATTGSVSFETPFPTGSTPLIFLMPTISETDANGDGPASVFLEQGSVTTSGFSWEQQEPPSPARRKVDSNNMVEVHWIAVTEGTHDLSNGTELIAGTVAVDDALIGSNSPYTDVILPDTQDIFLHQIQTQVNNCWLTTTSQFTTTGAEVALEASEVRLTSPNRCMEDRLENDEIAAETVAYMSLKAGNGTIELNGESTNFHFGNAQTFTSANIQDLDYQCNFTTSLTGFSDAPVLVSGKTSRRGGDGGWLRRCQLTNDTVSMVVDEDTYRDPDRRHIWEHYSFVALETTAITAAIDHFEYTHSGSALTCTAETLTLKACADASCSTTVSDTVSANLSPATITGGGGWVGGNSVSFSDSTQVDLRRNTTGSVTVGIINSVPTPINPTLCSIAGNTPTAAQCTFNFADSGFIFTVPDKLANKPASGISVSAVKKDVASQACVPQFADVTKEVGFWSDYVSPSSVISGAQVAVTGNGAATDIGTSVGARTLISLDFDANGEADISVNYPDAGQMQLNAQYDGTGEEDGLVMVGADSFVSFPVGLCVKPVDANASCAAGDSSCNVYKKAGEEFDLTIQGMAWQSDNDGDFCDNLTTPNYIHSGMTLGSELVSPIPGEQGSLSIGNYNHIAATNNTNTITQSISEVGVFEFTVKSPSTYEGSSFYDIPLASSGNIGRFVPDRFAISGVSVLPSCTGFSYMDQPFPLAMNISAFNIGSEVTKNYQGNFSKATALLVGEDSDNGDDKRNRLSALPISASSWVAGVATVDSSYMATLSRLAAPGKDGPFDSFDIGVIVDDNDGDFAFVANPDMNAATSGICGSNCDAKLLSTQRFRHGRIVMDNTYGAENDTLKMPIRAEYWNGSDWATNVEDSCSVVTPALTRQTDDAALGYQFEPALTSGQAIERTGQSSSFANGEFTLLWNALITGPNDYRGQVSAPLTVPVWLQWYWDWDDLSSTTLYDPRASAFFGRYRGHDRIIYWREVR